jgi:putative DNA primase/helicase
MKHAETMRSQVCEMISKEAWDGVERVGRAANPAKNDAGSVSWLTTYFGVEDSDYTRNVGRWWLISAVARVKKPGCHVDGVLVLRGPQGIGKSTGLRALAEPWFSEDVSLSNIERSRRQLDGLWIAEIDDIDAIVRIDDEAIRKFLSQPCDRYSFGRRTRDFPPELVPEHPRQCIFAITSNQRHATLGASNSGLWRCWVTRVDTDAIRQHRVQIWAEAKALYDAGHCWWPPADFEHPPTEATTATTKGLTP